MDSVNVWMWNIANESFVTYCRLSLMVVVVEVEVSHKMTEIQWSQEIDVSLTMIVSFVYNEYNVVCSVQVSYMYLVNKTFFLFIGINTF